VSDLLGIAVTRMNLILATGTVLVSVSLIAYLFVYNFRDPVARAFVLLLGFASIVYVGDVFLATARLPAEHPAAGFWLRFEWLGIAFVVPAFLHFGDALLLTTGDRSARRRRLLAAAYALGAMALLAVLTSDRLVGRPVGPLGAVYLAPGPPVPLFAALFFGGTIVGTRLIGRARDRALTQRSRRRMTYLLVSVIAPLSVFPYLVIVDGAISERRGAFLAFSGLASIATATMLVVVAYAVAYHGALTPDRTVKRELIKYLVQAPALGLFVIATVQLVPARLESSLGLPRDVVFALSVVIGIVVYQFVVRALRPVIDHLIYGPESNEVMWLRRIDEQLITRQDLAQLLESIVAAVCDRLRVSDGFVVVMNRGRLQIDTYAGSRERAAAAIDRISAEELAASPAGAPPFVVDGFRVYPLRPKGSAALGLLGVADPGRPLAAQEEAAVASLVASAEKALEDRIVQQRVVQALLDLEPELLGIQRLRGALEQRSEGDESAAIDADLVNDPDFPHWVKDALGHYWGGPRLTESPLLRLGVVTAAMEAHDYNAAKAMRSVLDEALERIKPEGERSLTASQWLVYNILELRFVRGLRVRDIAHRLAMSESDLYRKQRLAVEALAKQLAAMETVGPDTPDTTGSRSAPDLDSTSPTGLVSTSPAGLSSPSPAGKTRARSTRLRARS
jgi:hypothetical protein